MKFEPVEESWVYEKGRERRLDEYDTENLLSAGELGLGTIVGSAACNLMLIVGCCIMAIPQGQTRKIKDIQIFAVTSTLSLLAYLWLVIILIAVSPDEVEVWEGLVTVLLFPLLVISAYLTEKIGCPCLNQTKTKTSTKMEIKS